MPPTARPRRRMAQRKQETFAFLPSPRTHEETYHGKDYETDKGQAMPDSTTMKNTPKCNPRQVVLLRHGESAWNKKNLFTGWTNAKGDAVRARPNIGEPLVLAPNKTKLVCTIGTASESPDVLRQMLHAGMNVARLNLSHGDFAWHETVIGNLRRAAAAVDRRVAIMADLPGPKIRIGQLPEGPIELKRGDLFTLTTDEIIGDGRRVSVSFPRLPVVVKPADRLFLNDGYVELERRHHHHLLRHDRAERFGPLPPGAGRDLSGTEAGYKV